MEIGERLFYEGRRYVYLGTDPMSVPERRAYLEDAETGERRTVPWTDLLASHTRTERRPRTIDTRS